MRLKLLLIALAFLLLPAVAHAQSPRVPGAPEKEGAIIVGLITGLGTGSSPYIDFWVLDTLRGTSPGKTLGVNLPPAAISGVDIFELTKLHGQVYIIAYRGPADDKGRYTYAGPKFDSKEIIAAPANIAAVGGSTGLFDIPNFEQALKNADVVAVATITRYDSDKEINKLYYSVSDILKGHLDGRDITVILSGNYLYWLFFGGDFRGKGAPMVAKEARILLLKKRDGNFYYAGPEFTSRRFPATLENLSGTRQLLESKIDEPAVKRGFDWTWWIVGAVAAIVALLAALLVSKVDYKYDRRRERLEKLRSVDTPDSDAGGPGE